MRVTSHCANHPSRSAQIRCASCSKWMCERCVQEHGEHAYCSPRCRWTAVAKASLAHVRSVARHPIEPAWSIAIVTALCLLATAGISRLVVELLDVWSTPEMGIVEVAVALAPPSVSGTIVRDGDDWRLVLEGEPHGNVLLLIEGRPPVEIALDRKGRATVDGSKLPPNASSIRLAALPPDQDTVIPPTTTPSPTHTSTATPTATATHTPTASSTATPTPTPRVEVILAPSPTSVPATPLRPTATAIPRTKATPTGSIRVTPRPAPATPTRPEARTQPTQSVVRNAPPVLHLVTDAGPRLALTFDGASSSKGTADLLDLLNELDLKVTIFVTGGFIDAYPSLVRLALLAGHEIGNHTYSHPHLTTYATNRRHDTLPSVKREWFLDELRRTEEAFRRATGRPMAPLWRAPFGEENAQLRSWAMELGYLHIRWSSLQGKSLDSLDWVEDEHSSLYFDSSRMVDRLLAFPKLEGGIVLMHLATKRSVPPWSELPRFTSEVSSRGVEVGSVTGLLEASSQWRPWLERARARHTEIFGASDEP